ncbi:MAG: tetratricopeptide repeat protein [Terriglobales bacterium]|jgi:DNA-binding winged helix-turn-helix (wHTH) protein/Tfp pilus assembly protein PilF
MQTGISSAELVRFGAFEADLCLSELRKNGVKVKLQEIPFRALKLLLSRPNEIVSREEFRRALWPEDVFVDFDHGISSAINRLRDSIGDRADNPVFVETVDRRGYRWIAPTHIPVARTEALAAPPEIAVSTGPNSPRSWKWFFVLPLLALLFGLWMVQRGSPSAKAGIKVQPASSSTPSLAIAGLPRHVAKREAEDFYLKGRFYWNKRTPDSLYKAVDAFTQAIVQDPDYAPAYVGLADCYNLLREYTLMPASEAYPRAFAAAKRAVELDDQSSQAHASLAFVSFWGMWDAVGADREFRRAIALDPNNAIVHHWYATYLHAIGRSSEALVEIERARTLDPSSSSILADKGVILALSGRMEEGVNLLKQLEENEPDSVSPHRYLKTLYLRDGDYRAFLLESRKEAGLMHDAAALALSDAAEQAFAKDGKRALLETLRREQKKLYDQGTFSPYILAETCSLLGNKAEALQYLRVAYGKRWDRVPEMEADPAFAGLHQEPAFRQLLHEVGLPPIQ